MLWSDIGERFVDLSVEPSGQARLTDMSWQESVVEVSAVPLTRKPLFVEPLR